MGRLPPNLGTRETKSQFRDSGYNDAGRSHITETWDSPRGDDQFLTLTLNQCRFKYSSTWYTTHEILTKTSIILSLLLLRKNTVERKCKAWTGTPRLSLTADEEPEGRMIELEEMALRIADNE
jgi:hypothetical protein